MPDGKSSAEKRIKITLGDIEMLLDVLDIAQYKPPPFYKSFTQLFDRRKRDPKLEQLFSRVDDSYWQNGNKYLTNFLKEAISYYDMDMRDWTLQSHRWYKCTFFCDGLKKIINFNGAENEAEIEFGVIHELRHVMQSYYGWFKYTKDLDVIWMGKEYPNHLLHTFNGYNDLPWEIDANVFAATSPLVSGATHTGFSNAYWSGCHYARRFGNEHRLYDPYLVVTEKSQEKETSKMEIFRFYGA